MNNEIEKTNNNTEVKNDDFNFYITPLADVKENEDTYMIEIEMPGVNKDRVDIDIENDILTVKTVMEFANTEGEQDKKYLSKNFMLKNYKRKFNLNNSVDVNKISAEMIDGILKLSLPKSDNVKKKKINIELN